MIIYNEKEYNKLAGEIGTLEAYLQTSKKIIKRRDIQIADLKHRLKETEKLYNELVDGYNEARGEEDYRTKI